MGKITGFLLFHNFFNYYFEEPYPLISAYHNVKTLSFKKSLNFKIPLCTENVRTLSRQNSMVYFHSMGNDSGMSKSS